MSVLFTAIFSAASIVWDREFGFLREMLVAPVSRSAIVIGKCLGGATVSTFQGIVILALAGLAHVPDNPDLILTVIGELLLLSFTLTAFGVMMAARITQIQAFMALTQMLIMPLFFLSGALYPLRALPAGAGWAVPVGLSIAIVAVMGAVMLGMANARVPTHRVRTDTQRFRESTQ
jgi:ABC-2 type transport system permease protein